jgi:hypothetical protein
MLAIIVVTVLVLASLAIWRFVIYQPDPNKQANKIYYIIINEQVHGTPPQAILDKLVNRYKIKEPKARLLVEIAKTGEKQWFIESFANKLDGIYIPKE